MANITERLVDVLKGTMEINLRYTATVVSMATGYVSELGDMIRERAQRGGAAAAQASPRRAPILLVGHLNEEPSGAFALNNSSDRELSASLIVQGEIDPHTTELIPATVKLAPGASVFVRLKVKMTNALMENRDYRVAVLASGLPGQAVEYVVRRLPAAS